MQGVVQLQVFAYLASHVTLTNVTACHDSFVHCDHDSLVYCAHDEHVYMSLELAVAQGCVEQDHACKTRIHDENKSLTDYLFCSVCECN